MMDTVIKIAQRGLPFLILSMLCPVLFAQADIDDLRMWVSPDETRFIFETSEKAPYTMEVIEGPRLVMDFRNAHWKVGVSSFRFQQGIVRRIRSARQPNGDYRVVMDLRQKARARSYQLQPVQHYGHRLVLVIEHPGAAERGPVIADPVIDAMIPGPALKEPTISDPVKSKPAIPNPVEKDWGTADADIPDPVIEPLPLNPPVSADGDGKRSREAKSRLAPSAIQPGANTRAKFVVAIDAGHGGDDSGAVGRHGTLEKKVVLAIAQKLARFINGHGGMRALLIRRGDYYLSLRQRIRLARKANARLFVSIHADSVNNRRAHGSSVYILSQKGASDEASRVLAKRENEADLIGGVHINDKQDTLAHILVELSQQASKRRSRRLATDILEQMNRVGSLHSDQVKHAGFMVLKSPDIPSVLVETAFISNVRDERRLRSKKHQGQIAKAIYKGVLRYFQRHAGDRRGSGVVTRYIIRRGETLSMLARRFQVSEEALRRVNGLERDSLREGHVLLIP